VSDLFSVGLTLRVAITGREVFPTLKGHDLLRAIATQPIPAPDVPLSPGFARLIAALCASARDERPPSATVALAALDAACKEPAHLGPAPAPRPDPTPDPTPRSPRGLA
jgi:hypothetical protein